MKTKKSLLIALLLLLGQFTFQAYADAVKTVGATGSDYTTLKLAFDAINAGTLTGNVELQIKDNTTETVSADLISGGIVSITKVASGTGYTSAPTVVISAPPAGGIQATATVTVTGGGLNVFTITNPGYGYTSAPTISFTGGGGSGATATAAIATNFTSVKIYPIVTNKTISGGIGGKALIALSGVNNVTIDGRLHDSSGVLTGSTRDLTFTNTQSQSGSMTIQFRHNASNNTVNYCKIKGAGTSTSVGMITLNNPATANATGNYNNIISNNIFSAANTRPFVVIYSAGISGAVNTGNKFLDNDLENCLAMNNPTTCVNFAAYNNACTFTGNSFYETAANTQVQVNSAFTFLAVASGNNHTISNNYIGGTATQCGGGTFAKNGAANNQFKGILFTSTDAGTASKIENNVIKNISWTNGTSNTATWTAISIENTHNVDINGNTIGNISVTNNATGSNLIAINKTNGTTNQTISKNYIYGLTSTAASSGQIFGIYVSGGLTTVSNNIISLSHDNDVSTVGIYDHGVAGKTANWYFNTVQIGGTPTTGLKGSYAFWSQALSNTRDFRNNIFVNTRSNSGTASGSHYAAYFNYSANTNLTLDYNDYYVSGTGGVLGRYAGVNVTTGTVIVSGKDVASVSVNPGFANPTGTAAVDFTPSHNALVGVAGTGIATDYSGAARNIPTMGAWEVAPSVDLPTLAATVAATSITSTSASSGGEVTDGGTSAVTARGVCWSTSTLPTVDLETKTTDGSGTGSFTSSITGLSSYTTYYVRAYATNASGTAYGTEISFTTLDNQAPTAFTATEGAITFNSVELLLNATDNAGSIYYTISYGSGPTIINTTGVSGVEKSYILTGLEESTAYTFSVVAKDAAANEAANSPIVVNATTTENTNTECEGISTEASQESFVIGYNYKFRTSGTDVIVEFELLDNKDGVVAYAWTYNPNFAEAAMTLVSGKKFTKTFTGQTIDATFRVSCKFAFAGGMAVTKIYDYTVGNNCITTELTSTELQSIRLFPNPVQNELRINTEQPMSLVTIHNILGQTVKTISVSGNENTIDLSTFSSGNYFVTIALENGNLIKQKILKL